MVVLTDITEIADLEIVSLEEIARASSKPRSYERWFGIQDRVKQDKKAPSLSAYLLYQYQFLQRGAADIAKEFSIDESVLGKLMRKMKIPLRTRKENDEIRYYKNAPSRESLLKMFQEQEMSADEIADKLGKKRDIVLGWFRYHGIKYRNRSEATVLYMKKKGNPFSGKKHSESTKKKLAEMHSKLTDDGLYALAMDYIYFDDTFDELKQNYGIKILNEYMRRAVSKQFITKEQYRKAFSRKLSDKIKSVLEQKGKRKYSSEYKENMRKKNSGDGNPFSGRQHTEESKQAMREARLTPELIQLGLEQGLWAAKNKRNLKQYGLDGRSFDSKSEAAVGILLEKYIPGYKIIRDKTFQANGDTFCLFDFILDKAIVEWHPIVLKYATPSKDRRAYEELRAEIRTPEERKALNDLSREIAEDLAVQYWMKRQDASDKSQIYQGKEVILARSFNELYDLVLSKYGDPTLLPTKRALRKEFKQLRYSAMPAENVIGGGEK